MAAHNDTTNKSPDTANLLGDVSLWVRLDFHRSTRANECEIASAIVSAVNTNSVDIDHIEPKDILGVQYMSTKQPYWIINLASTQVKGRVLAADAVTIKGKTFKLSDFSNNNPQRKRANTRLSIHGIPQHVTDDDIESWVKSFAKLDSRIFRHKSKDKGLNNQFHHLHTGHRFCYVSEITEHKPRYSTINIPCPLNPTSLIEVEVTLFYTGQSDIFCKYCHNCDHQIADCPTKPIKKCYHCGQTGHVKFTCPHKDKGPKCFNCDSFGHRSYECPTSHDTDMESDLDSSTSSLASESATRSNDREELRVSEASALAQELIDHCLNPDSNKSPELLKKVKSVLKLDTINSQSEQENQEEGTTESSRKKSKGKHSKKTKKMNKSKSNNSESSFSGGKKKQTTLNFESTKPPSKRKVTSPNDKNEHPDKREKKDSDLEDASTSTTHGASRNVTVGQKILSMISPKK